MAAHRRVFEFNEVALSKAMMYMQGLITMACEMLLDKSFCLGVLAELSSKLETSDTTFSSQNLNNNFFRPSK